MKLNKFCPSNSIDDLFLLFCINPSSMTPNCEFIYKSHPCLYLLKAVVETVKSGPPDILSQAAMSNAYYICHNVQVGLEPGPF